MPNAPYKLSDVQFFIGIQTDPSPIYQRESPWKNLKEFVNAGQTTKTEHGRIRDGLRSAFFRFGAGPDGGYRNQMGSL